ncbi:MAG: hypothetical protein WCT05_15855, partial [Lentisphaeria bacterium]
GKTNLIYDFRSSYDPATCQAHLPTLAEIVACLPNPCGWGSGMEDSVINGGVMLEVLIDRYQVSGDSSCIQQARAVFQGLRDCARVHQVKGFVARSISPLDGRSCYPESSRDQYTHFGYGLWAYYNSKLAGEQEKQVIRELLVDVAVHLEKHITAENDYTIPRCDNKLPRSSVCKMWQVHPHEAARLPMLYAAAYAVTGDRHWFEKYRQYAYDAAEQSLQLPLRKYHAYALLQMQSSLRLLYEVELEDQTLRQKYLDAMHLAATYSEFAGWLAAHEDYECDYSALPGNWRTITAAIVIPGCRHCIPVYPASYRDAARRVRESGEAPLVQMMVPGREISTLQLELLVDRINRFNPEKHASYGGLYLIAAYWRCMRLKMLGAINKKND